MMKRLLIFLALICAATTLFAQVALPEHQFAAGRWGFVGTRLYQNDTTAGLAKMNLRIPQSGPMLYEFTARYEDGLQDGHGGFGLHIYGDSAYNGPSWGAGKSILLWLNYDEKPVTRGFPTGFTAQIYRSVTNSQMELLDSFDLNWTLPYITWDDLRQPVPIKIWINGETGEVRVYDPSDPTLTGYFYFNLPQRDLPLRGNWVSLRTNGASLSFGMGL
jgi:hypothetical protein